MGGSHQREGLCGGVRGMEMAVEQTEEARSLWQALASHALLEGGSASSAVDTCREDGDEA